MNKEAIEKIEQVLINRCEECVRAVFGDARDASQCVAKDRDKIIQALESYRKLPGDKPPLVDNPYVYESEECREYVAFGKGKRAQRETDIKHYEG